MRGRDRWVQVFGCLVLGVVLATSAGASEPASGRREPAAGRRFAESVHEGGVLRYLDDVPVMVLSGSPEDMGEQHAMLVAHAAREIIEYPKDLLRRYHVEAAWPLVAAASRLMVTRLPEDHRRELQTMIDLAKTRDLDEDVLAVANTLLELRRIGGCSALIVEAERAENAGPLLGRNLDLPPMGVLDQYTVVVVYRPLGKRSFCSIGFPGLVGVLSGMNDAGLAIATLDVTSANDGSGMFDPTGTPLTFSFRRILEECASVEEAEAVLRESRRTTWMNLAACDRRGGVVLELTPKSVVVRRPSAGMLPCTNHFRSAELMTSTDCWRYDRLEEAGRLGRLGLREVGQSLHAAHQGPLTIQTMIFEPATLTLHLAAGPGPSSALPLRRLALASLLTAGTSAPAAARAARPE